MSDTPSTGRKDPELLRALSVAAAAYADELRETKHDPRDMIWRLTKHLGADVVREQVERAKQIEANGGMTLANGQRRTLGGIFFYNMKQSLGLERFSAIVLTAEQRAEKRHQGWLARDAKRATQQPGLPAQDASSDASGAK